MIERGNVSEEKFERKRLNQKVNKSNGLWEGFLMEMEAFANMSLAQQASICTCGKKVLGSNPLPCIYYNTFLKKGKWKGSVFLRYTQ